MAHECCNRSEVLHKPDNRLAHDGVRLPVLHKTFRRGAGLALKLGFGPYADCSPSPSPSGSPQITAVYHTFCALAFAVLEPAIATVEFSLKAEMRTSLSTCEPPDEPDSLVQVDDGLCPLNQRYATE